MRTWNLPKPPGAVFTVLCPLIPQFMITHDWSTRRGGVWRCVLFVDSNKEILLIHLRAGIYPSWLSEVCLLVLFSILTTNFPLIGTIGTLLFVQIGTPLTQGGPANLLIAFVLWCTVILAFNNCLGTTCRNSTSLRYLIFVHPAEMVVYMPISSPFVCPTNLLWANADGTSRVLDPFYRSFCRSCSWVLYWVDIFPHPSNCATVRNRRV